MGFFGPCSVGSWTRPEERRPPGNRRLFRGGLRGLQPRASADQWIRMASVMPEIRPLRPISHLRSGKPVMFMAQSLGQLPRAPAADQPNRRLASFEAPDARHGGAIG